MKSFRELIAEVAEPKGGDEKAFKDKHIIEKIPHPVALDHQFTGEIGAKSSKRRADHSAEEGESVYEGMDPVNKKALKGKHSDRKDKDIDNDGDVDSSDEYLHKRRKAISTAIKTQKEEADLEEAKAKKTTTITRKTINRALQGMKVKPKNKVSVVKAPWDKKEETEELQEFDAKTQKKFVSGAKAMKAYAQKDGGVDKKDFMQVAKIMDDIAKTNILQAGPILARLNKLVDGMDTDVRERIYVELKKVGLVEEVEQIDELSKKTLGNYAKKASDDRAKNALQIGKTGKVNFKGLKRSQGINKAINKLTAESVEQIEEATKFKAGMLKLKDGSSMIIKKQDADLLTQMFKDLTPANRKKMEKVAMEDKEGFEEILGFAREAL